MRGNIWKYSQGCVYHHHYLLYLTEPPFHMWLIMHRNRGREGGGEGGREGWMARETDVNLPTPVAEGLRISQTSVGEGMSVL